MKERDRILALLAAMLLFVFSARGASAWESDVHYGLVKWLAVHAGFSLDDAEIVAVGSETPDETSVLSATGVSELVICNPAASAHVEASRHVQRYHFPSGGYPPALPENRKVTPGQFRHSTISNRWTRQEIEIDWDSADVEPQNILAVLGASLHPLADSWSHQGKPGIPIPWVCPEKTAWGHPDSRGGPRSHHADITSKYPTDTLETAETIHAFLVKFLDANPGRFSGGSRRRFEDVESDAAAFARASTKSEKHAWFVAQDSMMPFNHFTTYPCFLRSLSIRGRTREIPCAGPAETSGQGETETGAILPMDFPVTEQGVRGFVDEMLKTWIVDRNYDAVAGRFFDIESVRQNLLGERTPRVIEFFGRDWDQMLFSMWLVADHGAVSELGHGLPDDDNNVPLAKAVYDLAKVESFQSVPQAIRSPSGMGPYDLIPIAAGADYLVSFKFRHVPNDVLALRAQSRGTAWRITALDWVTK